MQRTERIWAEALERGRLALKSGSLVPLETELIPPQGWEPFQLRRLLSATPKHLRAQGPKPNPFRPWDSPLQVRLLGRRHLVLLNKYPVQAGHVLLITQAYQPQSGWLDDGDWAAVALVDADTGGLWFFNSCAEAGASQPHRHLQLLPRHGDQAACPLDGLLRAQLAGAGGPWPWAYRLSPRRPGEGAEALAATYHAHALALGLGEPAGDPRPRHPYNLMFTDHWFLTVRREREHVAGFSVNALGFAGYLLLSKGSELAWLQREGPWALLQAAAAKG
ncbi:ATP adenylyltransferase [Synechococcus sp. 1G10]|uniref:ATP adenylyltransferase n=1 Tax=Synechococcus sp. 1G10 TaxID=2025605 RepID=UPI000B9978BE|nr:ATP adenylyltransferase [Synechococcus sp. 1G10]